jgi:hypothetical protein
VNFASNPSYLEKKKEKNNTYDDAIKICKYFYKERCLHFLLILNFHSTKSCKILKAEDRFLPKPASKKNDRFLMDPTDSALAHMQGVPCVSLKINSLP